MSNQKKIEESADHSEKIDVFHKVKEGACNKLAYVHNGKKVANFGNLMPETKKMFEEL